MILLDTDHLSVLEIPAAERTQRLRRRLNEAGAEEIGTTIISVEVQPTPRFRGDHAQLLGGCHAVVNAATFGHFANLR